MKLSYIYLLCSLNSVCSLGYALPICKNCKHFMNNKCKLFPRIDESKSKPIIDYYYCSTTRKFPSMCGYEGKYYKDNNEQDDNLFFEYLQNIKLDNIKIDYLNGI